MLKSDLRMTCDIPDAKNVPGRAFMIQLKVPRASWGNPVYPLQRSWLLIFAGDSLLSDTGTTHVCGDSPCTDTDCWHRLTCSFPHCLKVTGPSPANSLGPCSHLLPQVPIPVTLVSRYSSLPDIFRDSYFMKPEIWLHRCENKCLHACFWLVWTWAPTPLWEITTWWESNWGQLLSCLDCGSTLNFFVFYFLLA